jgi:hypothetical protein
MLRKLTVVLVGAVALAGFSGCASTGSATQTPAQIAAVVCPNVQAEIATLNAAGVFTGGAASTLANQITPDVAAVCTAGATVTAANLQTLVNAAIPVAATVISNSPMTPQDKAIALLALGGAQTIVNTALGIVDANNVAASVTAPAAQ